MPIQNITKMYLLNVPLEKDYKNTLYFADANAQQSYFQSRTVKSFTDFSYQRKEQIIRIPEHYDNLYNVNYCMYQNSAYGNKWFYCFVNDLKYVNDGLTEATIETDVLQTWMFDYTLKSCFVEREHVSDDTIGSHTVPEGLETGEYVCEAFVEEDTVFSNHIVISATYDCFTDTNAGSNIHGIYSGVDYFLIYGDDVDAISHFLSVYAGEGKIDSITGMFMTPSTLVNYSTITWDTMPGTNYKYKKLTSTILGTSADLISQVALEKPYSNVNGYVPRNNKLYVYPYKYLMASNNAGGDAVYHYEYFQYYDTTRKLFGFNIYGTLTPGCSIRMIPRKYKNVELNYDEGLNYGKFPVCSYNVDMYTNWLTQNGLNLGISVFDSTLKGAISGASAGGSVLGLPGAIGGGAIGLLSGVMNAVGEVVYHHYIPPQARGNISNGDVNFSMNINHMMFYEMSIRSEYAQIIDKFFDMYGYKVNAVKVPNKNHRSRWWYTKTIGCAIDGNLPQNDINKIISIYDKGIRFWKNASEIENYNLTNPIV